MTDNFNKELCEERHERIDGEFKRGRERMDGINKKVWGIVILLLSNLIAAVIGISMILTKSIVLYK